MSLLEARGRLTNLANRVNAARKAARSRKLMRAINAVSCANDKKSRNAPRGLQAMITTETILAVIDTADTPLTTDEVAVRIPGSDVLLIRSRLSKLADYDRIGREYRKVMREGNFPITYCLWHSLAPSPASAPRGLTPLPTSSTAEGALLSDGAPRRRDEPPQTAAALRAQRTLGPAGPKTTRVSGRAPSGDLEGRPGAENLETSP